MISMELEGVTDVRPADDDFQYLFSVSRETYPASHTDYRST